MSAGAVRGNLDFGANEWLRCGAGSGECSRALGSCCSGPDLCLQCLLPNLLSFVRKYEPRSTILPLSGAGILFTDFGTFQDYHSQGKSLEDEIFKWEGKMFFFAFFFFCNWCCFFWNFRKCFCRSETCTAQNTINIPQDVFTHPVPTDLCHLGILWESDLSTSRLFHFFSP